MATLTAQQAVAICYEAGFRWNQGIVLMPAIGWAESRLRTDARGYNRDENGNVTSVDRGWLQINDKYHPSMSDADCDDPLKAAKYAFSISNKGTDFNPWSAFKNGSYRGPEGLNYERFMAEWRDFAARQILMPQQKAAYEALEARYDKLVASLAMTTEELRQTTAALTQSTSDLKTAVEDGETLAALLASKTAEYDECTRISIARQIKIDNAKAALA